MLPIFKSIFTPRYLIFLVLLLSGSIAVTYSLTPSVDDQIDAALQYSLDGQYLESIKILAPLAERDIPRAQLYLGVAFYHGNGVEKNPEKAREIFMRLKEINYESGIVNTYLNFLMSGMPSHS